MSWKLIEKRHIGTSIYGEWYSQRVVLVNKGKQLCLTPASTEVLGNPTHVQLLTNGHKLGIQAADRDSDNAFTITDKPNAKLRVIASTGASEFLNAQPGQVYDTTFEDGILVIDPTQPRLK